MSPQPATGGVTALVPIKARSECKTRLADALDCAQRIRLARSMLDHVISVLQQVAGIERIVVLSPERDQLSSDIECYCDEGHDLNSSLAAAVKKLRREGVERILILPADLAQLEKSDIDYLLEEGAHSDITIAACSNGSGTNALLFDTSQNLKMQFGPDSFSAHTRWSAAHGFSCQRVDRPGLANDVDTTQNLPENFRPGTAADRQSRRALA